MADSLPPTVSYPQHLLRVDFSILSTQHVDPLSLPPRRGNRTEATSNSTPRRPPDSPVSLQQSPRRSKQRKAAGFSEFPRSGVHTYMTTTLNARTPSGIDSQRFG